MIHHFHWTIERDGIEHEIEIDGTYHFGAPASGGEPAEPDEFEWEALGLPEGVTLTDEECVAIETYGYENPPEDDDYPEPDLFDD